MKRVARILHLRLGSQAERVARTATDDEPDLVDASVGNLIETSRFSMFAYPRYCPHCGSWERLDERPTNDRRQELYVAPDDGNVQVQIQRRPDLIVSVGVSGTVIP